MADSFNEKLTKILKKDIRFVEEESGELIRNEIINSALKIDKKLIEALLDEKEIKDFFFTEIKGHWVFDLNKFIEFIQDKKFLSDSYTKFKQNIRLNIDGKTLKERGETSLVWPFKDCILEGGMTKEDQKRTEIFFNEILAQDEIDRLLDPKVLTNFKRVTAKGEEKVTDFKRDKEGTIRENLIIKGNNLLALHSLKKEFQDKVKLIYIDPPYNRDADSFYNDNFKRSTWLTFMKNRLEVAKQLLKPDGIIFVQIDEKEFGYLKVLMDEIFENAISTINVKTRSDYGVAQEDFIYTVNEYILVYSKNKVESNVKYVEKDLDPESKFFDQYTMQMLKGGVDKVFKELEGGKVGKVKIYEHKEYEVKRIGKKDRNSEYYKKNLKQIFRTSNSQGAFLQRMYKEIPPKGLFSIEYTPTKGPNAGKLFRYFVLDGGTILWASNIFQDKEQLVRNHIITNDWSDISWLGISKEGDVKLKNGKKPEQLIKRIIDISTMEEDIVLDYHLGSGTTCAVAHKLGRQFIGVEQLFYGKNDSVVRLKNVLEGDQSGISKEVNWKGGGNFICCELLKFNEEAINKIESSKTTEALLKIWKEMSDHYFLNYDVDIKRFNDNQEEFKKLPIEKQKKLLCEMLNKNQLYVNLSEIDDTQFKVSEEDKELNKSFYNN